MPRGLVEVPKGFGSREFKPFATALSYGGSSAWVLDWTCTARRIRAKIRAYHLKFQRVTGKKTLVESPRFEYSRKVAESAKEFPKASVWHSLKGPFQEALEQRVLPPVPCLDEEEKTSLQAQSRQRNIGVVWKNRFMLGVRQIRVAGRTSAHGVFWLRRPTCPA